MDFQPPPADIDRSHYEIRAFARNGEELRLHDDPEARPYLVVEDVFTAVTVLANVPAMGWCDWTDASMEQFPVHRIQLFHNEVALTSRKHRRYSTNLLETITR